MKHSSLAVTVANSVETHLHYTSCRSRLVQNYVYPVVYKYKMQHLMTCSTEYLMQYYLYLCSLCRNISICCTECYCLQGTISAFAAI